MTGVLIMAGSFSHLSLEDRFCIERGLMEHMSFKSIAAELGRHPSSVSLEVRRHAVRRKSGGSGSCFNDCVLRFGCKVSSLCGNRAPCSKRYCRSCTLCSSVCRDYSRQGCALLLKPPYVCNGCRGFRGCTLEKSVYRADAAHGAYAALLRESRSGLSVDEGEVARLNSIVSPMIRSGQSIYHITANNKGSIMCSPRTIYNYVGYGVFDAINLDLPRKVRYRHRRRGTHSFKVDTKCRSGRGYDDFLAYLEANGGMPVAQMDSVEGAKGGSVLLTIHFTDSLLLLAFLRGSNTSSSVTAVFDMLYSQLGRDAFMDLFPVILTDNGSEFSDPSAIEFDTSGLRRTHVFYCEPSSPYQKGAVENNHELLRRVLPKGRCFDSLTQDDVGLVLDHIDSYSRRKLNGKSPYEMFSFLHGYDTAEKLGLHMIPANDIVLTPALLRHR